MALALPARLPSESPQDGPQAPLTTLTYRSRAAAPLETAALAHLLAQAKARNRRLGVTGMLLVAESQFYQWIEGPPDGVEAVWEDIRRDPRHRDVELIDRHAGAQRVFGDWDMKFVRREEPLAVLRDPRAAGTPLPLGLIQKTAKLALDGDQAALIEGLSEALFMGPDFLALHGALIEPAERLLGDWWGEDKINAFDMALCLAYLQSAMRTVGVARGQGGGLASVGRRLLIAAPPGEPHVLGVALVGDLFRGAGWRVRSEFPANAEALAASVRGADFDVLNLCLSDAFERRERIEPLLQTIRVVRAASANPALVVVVGGRAFIGRPDLAAAIGADAVYAGAKDALEKTRVHVGLAQRPRPASGPPALRAL